MHKIGIFKFESYATLPKKGLFRCELQLININCPSSLSRRSGISRLSTFLSRPGAQRSPENVRRQTAPLCSYRDRAKLLLCPEHTIQSSGEASATPSTNKNKLCNYSRRERRNHLSHGRTAHNTEKAKRLYYNDLFACENNNPSLRSRAFTLETDAIGEAIMRKYYAHAPKAISGGRQ